MKIQANQLSSQLARHLAPCYLVTGDEPLLVDEALDAIRRAAREQGFGTRELFVATAGFDWQALADCGSNLSLFADKRIVELRLPTGKPGVAGSQAIVDFVARLDADMLFLVSAPKLERGPAKWARAIEERGVALPLWPVGPRELPGWIAERMKRAGLKPEREAVEMIADRVEGNLLAAQQEIEKLALLLGRASVTAEDVRKAVADSSRFDVYKLADAALAGDAPRALRILSGLEAEGVEPVFAVWSLTRDLRALATLADAIRRREDLGQAMQRAGVWRNRQPLVRSCLARHAPGGFYRLLKAAGQADRTAKGQAAGDPWQLMTAIILALATGSRRAA